MILLHDIIQIFHLSDGDVRAVLFVIALDGGFIGITAINGDRLGEPIAANRLLQTPQRGFGVPLLREEKVDGLAVLIHRPIQIAPLAFDLNVRLVPPPADPHRALTPVECLFQQGTVFHDPALDRRVVDRDPTLLQ